MSKHIIVVTGPSGVGKTYLAEQLTTLYPSIFETAKLYTTRPSRPNEIGSDRIFMNKTAFDEMKQADMFAVTGEFHHNLYGYSRDALIPKNKHVLLNTWPAMIPKFLDVQNVILVALMPDPALLPVLIDRIDARGEEDNVTKQRKDLIYKDMKILDKHAQKVAKNGRFFYVKDNDTVPDEIIPWIIQRISLNH